VGGIKEKVLAAKRAGIAAMLLPKLNRKDLEEIPATALEMKFDFWSSQTGADAGAGAAEPARLSARTESFAQ
jgi:ATP-dependent Lon protease